MVFWLKSLFSQGVPALIAFYHCASAKYHIIMLNTISPQATSHILLSMNTF